MTMKIEGLEHAQVFWGLAKDGMLAMKLDGTPFLFAAQHEAIGWDDEHPVRVYIIVEDD